MTRYMKEYCEYLERSWEVKPSECVLSVGQLLQDVFKELGFLPAEFARLVELPIKTVNRILLGHELLLSWFSDDSAILRKRLRTFSVFPELFYMISKSNVLSHSHLFSLQKRRT